MTQTWPESEYLVNDRYRFVLCPIPKVASSSLKQWFLTTIGYAPDMPDWPLRPHAFLTAWKQTQHRGELPDYPLVVFVRNPLRRLVSAFLQKFVERWDIEHAPSRPVVEAVCRRAGRAVDFASGISFREFVAFLSEREPTALDVHWRPQHLFFRERPHLMLGRVESLDRDLGQICERLGIHRAARFETLRLSYHDAVTPCVADLSAGAFRGLGAYPPWASFFDSDIRATVARIYAEDFRRFGYDPADGEQRRPGLVFHTAPVTVDHERVA